MPDHLHLLLEGNETLYLPGFMKLFKQKSSFSIKKQYDCILWKRGYYDHVLREEESYNEVTAYIWNNPVRRGLVDDFTKYRLSGSFVLEKENPF
jgi:putative transposase